MRSWMPPLFWTLVFTLMHNALSDCELADLLPQFEAGFLLCSRLLLFALSGLLKTSKCHQPPPACATYATLSSRAFLRTS